MNKNTEHAKEWASIMGKSRLLGTANTKTMKGQKRGYMTAIMHLSPHKVAGMANVCPHASEGCAAACLNTSGRGIMEMIQEARARKTRLWFERRDLFLAQLEREIVAHGRKARRAGFAPAIRLNGTSDIPWERHIDMEGEHGGIAWYDYTKFPLAKRDPAANYFLTFSWSEKESARDHAREYLTSGRNVAVPFRVKRGEDLPGEFLGHPVIDGDTHDLRFTDPSPCIVGLRVKGIAGKADESGFIVDPATL